VKAPEGSPALIEARRTLLYVTRRALERGLSEDEWTETLGNVYRHLVELLGEREIPAIIAMSRGR
jgi:hypothetical protein